MSDWEDYELCFAAAGEVPARVGEVPVTVVGRFVERGGRPSRELCGDDAL